MKSGMRELIRREMESHPGVGFRFEHRGKHDSVILTVGARSRFVVFPCTPSDCRGPKNKLRDIRHTIRDLKEARA